MDDEKVYLTISLDSVTLEAVMEILTSIVSIRGTRHGMSISYNEPIE